MTDSLIVNLLSAGGCGEHAGPTIRKDMVWKDDRAGKLYRRALYTHMQRTFLYPFLMNFNA